jgi:glucose/arabinose dehydrogenase
MQRFYTLWICSVVFLACTHAQPTVTFTPMTLSGPALVNPVDITGAGDGSNRLFVVEKRGTIRIIKNGTVLSNFFLDIQTQVMNSGERGLLGMAFHPQYPDSPYVYVNYVINGTITNRISRFTKNVSNADDLVEGSELILLEQTGVQTNHKAGDLAFGPDGYLYFGFGDGGGAFDPNNNGQNLNILLAKIIRIDINSKTPPLNYSIPPDNPFVGINGLDEIWYFGIRNPWRISFDRATGDFWIADVGQNEWEEVDFIPAGTPGGLNFGWDCQEGTHPLETQNCQNPVYTWPIFEYPHNCPCPNGQGASISGGFVYRGNLYPALKGYYICADYVSNYYWLIKKTGTPPTFTTYSFNGTGMIDDVVAFGEDDNGELYACNHLGPLYKISATGPLPVKWASIDAWHIPNGNRVEWTIHETSGIDHFELQRSLAPDFIKLTRAAIVSPVQDSTHYGTDDAYLQNDAVYYRVVAFMSNGTKEYSPIARLLPEQITKPTLIFDFTLNTWRLSIPDDWQTGRVVIYDVQGKEVFTKKLSQDKMMELPPPIVPGVYFIEINSDSGNWSDKLVW